MKLVILESPYSGDVEGNTIYARRCMEDSLKRGESPMVSHLLYTQVLDDKDPEQRATGIEAGLAWRKVAEKLVVYNDRGITIGMRHGIKAAKEQGIDIQYRRIGDNPSPRKPTGRMLDIDASTVVVWVLMILTFIYEMTH